MIRARHTLDDLVSDMRTITRKAPGDMKAAVRECTMVGNQLAKDDARRKARRHGKHYAGAFTWETSAYAGFGGATYQGIYGPDSSRKQGGMSFEDGSRNQTRPHRSLAISADVAGPKLAAEVRDLPAGWFWPES